MDGDSEIRNILPQYPVVDKAGQINPQGREAQKRKLRNGAGQNKARGKNPARAEEDTYEEHPWSRSGEDPPGENEPPGDAPHKPGEKIDLVI